MLAMPRPNRRVVSTSSAQTIQRPRPLLQVRTRVPVELDAARAQVGLVVFQLEADVAQQAGQHGLVQLLVAGGLVVQAPLVLGHHRQQLAVHVAPFAHAADVDVVLAQQLFVLAGWTACVP
jgi:hypothetical protein